MKVMNMRMFADGCEVFECVPWKQVERGSVPTMQEIMNVAAKYGRSVTKNADLMKVGNRIFVKAEDMAVCLMVL